MNAFFPRSFLKDCPVVDSAQGVWIKDKSGKEYIDGCCGAIVTNLGHGVPELIEAIVDQAKKMPYAHTSQFWSEPALELSSELIHMAPKNFHDGGRVFLTSGGSESVETALKMVRGHFVERKDINKHIIISRWHGYHGASIGALSATGHPARREPYLPILKSPTLIHTAYEYRCKCGFGPGPCKKKECEIARANELEEAIILYGPDNVMAFMGEPIVGATLGAAVPGPEYWRRIREICTKYNVLLIVDEVMVGLGRTGKNFAINHWDVEPDLIVLGKGLAAGYQPLGAVIASPEIVESFQKNSGRFEHGYTYSGHPVASAAGLASLKYVQKHNLVERVLEREQGFFSRFEELKKFSFVGDVRGKGFFAGIEFVKNKSTKEPYPAELRISRQITKAAQDAGVLVYPGAGFIDGKLGDHILIAPPFIATDKELDELFSRLSKAFEAVEKNIPKKEATVLAK